MVAEADSRQDGSIDYKCPNRIIDVSLVTRGADEISLNTIFRAGASQCSGFSLLERPTLHFISAKSAKTLFIMNQNK